MKRTCDGCTKCCEGWLAADIDGHFMQPGIPCYFLKESKCTIYSTRPTVCKEFLCAWMLDERLDEDLKPDKIHQIITYSNVDGIEWYEIVEAGEKISPEVLKRIIDFANNNQLNLKYKKGTGIISGMYLYILIGTEEFKQKQIELAG